MVSYVDRLRPFQATAREGGLVELNELSDGTVLWLKKNSPGESSEIHERMFIDSLTNRTTAFWGEYYRRTKFEDISQSYFTARMAE
jgi:hypothetical protein